MPLLTPSSVKEIANLVYDHISQDRPFYKIPDVMVAVFGKADNYMIKSAYAGLCGFNLNFPVSNGRFVPEISQIQSELSKALEKKPGRDLIVVFTNKDMWQAVEEDPDGATCLARARSTPCDRFGDPIDSIGSFIEAARQAGISTTVIGNDPAWDPREDSNDWDPDELPR